MTDQISPAIVLDNGSGICKVGFSGDDAPRSCFPTIIGKPIPSKLMVGMDEKDIFVGHEAKELKDVMEIDNPICRGQIINWEQMENVWHHSFYHELKMAPEDHRCFIAETPLNSRQNRERIANVMFENFNFPYFYISVLALYAAGKTTGIVLDSGYGQTHAVPVYEGYQIPHAIMRLELGGDDLTKFLKQHITNLNLSLYEVEMIKEQTCYIPEDYDYELRNQHEEQFELPDGQTLIIGKQKIQCPQLLFQPQNLSKQFLSQDKNSIGVHELIQNSIQKCDQEIRKDLYGSVVLSGGSTLFNGISQRLHKELTTIAPSNYMVNITAPDERKYSTWIGGSILSSLSSFQVMWISKTDYEEFGANVVHKKCI